MRGDGWVGNPARWWGEFLNEGFGGEFLVAKVGWVGFSVRGKTLRDKGFVKCDE